ncbi:MAG: stage II sporulation protein M [Lactobacillaceae bacterium]|jgi:uncharacterized membrane protein SpoIIM required for sporulation|nr:stage II sporulation protein M [Lactobacillaceae bacterium]
MNLMQRVNYIFSILSDYFNKYFLLDKKAIKRSFLVFLLGSIIGAMFSYLLLLVNHAPTNMPIVLKAEAKPPIFFHILINNIIVSLVMISGTYLFKLPTYLGLIANGSFFGFILETNIYTSGHLFYFLKLVSVHGPLEIAALLLAASLGLQSEIFSNTNNIKKLSNTLILILFFLLVAALLESKVTPLLW